MYSSLSIVFKKEGSLYWGWTRHLAVAIIAAVNGPVTPVGVKNSAIFGVNLNGTGLLASRSPVKEKLLLLLHYQYLVNVQYIKNYTRIKMV